MEQDGFRNESGKAIVAPSYHKYVTKSTLNLVASVPQTFLRVTGPHRIVMEFTPPVGLSKTWSFALTGGTNTVSPSVLPMFPRDPQKLYNPTINYKINGDDLPSFGCSIITLPVPPQSAMTTRINVFQVTETVTGMGLSFIIAECPYSGIDPTIVCTTSVTVEIKIISYRAKGNNYRAVGWLESKGAPSYYVYNFPTKFTSVGGINPLDAHIPLPFSRVSGTQTILVADITTGFYFSFDVDYGVVGQGGGYLGSINSTGNAKLASDDVENAVVSITSPADVNAQIKIEKFTLAAIDGRTYVFTFDPTGYNQIPPTIQLVSGPALGGDNLVVNVFVRYFQTL